MTSDSNDPAKILDISCIPSSVLSIHSKKGVILVGAGCSIILWDLKNNKKIQMHEHKG